MFCFMSRHKVRILNNPTSYNSVKIEPSNLLPGLNTCLGELIVNMVCDFCMIRYHPTTDIGAKTFL